MIIVLCIALLAGAAVEEIVISPEQPVAGGAITITIPASITSGTIHLSSPFGKWSQFIDVSTVESTVSVQIPDDIPILLVGMMAADDLEVEHRAYPLVDASGQTVGRPSFWYAYLSSGFPSPYPIGSADKQKALEFARKAIEQHPEYLVSQGLLWRLQAQAEFSQEERDAFLSGLDSALAAKSSGKLAMEIATINLMLGDRAGASRIDTIYKEQIDPVRKAESERWLDITATHNPKNRINKILSWLEDDPLNSFTAQLVQILAASYSAIHEYRSTALYGALSLKIMPDDAMTLNGVAFALAEEEMQLPRGLLFVERALTILNDPQRLNKPEALSERRWKSELDAARSAALDTKGWLLTKMKRWHEARDAFDLALSIRENDEFYYHYGRMLQVKGDLDEARKKFRQGLKLAGHKRTDIRNALDELDRQ